MLASLGKPLISPQLAPHRVVNPLIVITTRETCYFSAPVLENKGVDPLKPTQTMISGSCVHVTRGHGDPAIGVQVIGSHERADLEPCDH